MIIYKAENKVNSKIYIGETRHKLETRIYDHIRMGGAPVFHNAIEKYGIENFNISIIDTAKTTEDLNEKEKYWIGFYNCKVPNGYNLTNGGEGLIGWTPSENWREKHRGKNSSSKRPEVQKKISDSLRGKPREDMKGENNPAKRPEVRVELSRNNCNKKLEVREDKSKSLKKAWKDPLKRKNILNAQEEARKRRKVIILK